MVTQCPDLCGLLPDPTHHSRSRCRPKIEKKKLGSNHIVSRLLSLWEVSTFVTSLRRIRFVHWDEVGYNNNHIVSRLRYSVCGTPFHSRLPDLWKFCNSMALSRLSPEFRCHICQVFHLSLTLKARKTVAHLQGFVTAGHAKSSHKAWNLRTSQTVSITPALTLSFERVAVTLVQEWHLF